MKSRQPKKFLIFYILDILRKYTDENHRLSQKEIGNLLKSRYEMIVDRKSIKTNLMDLIELGFDIEYDETVRLVKNRKTGEIEESYILSDFYMRHEFTDAELRLLIDGLLFSRHIPYRQCRELVGKLEGLSSDYFLSRMKHIATMPEDRTDNKQIFYNIAILDEAISHNRKVQFKYVEYDIDGKQHIKTRADGTERIYVVSPYQMAAKEGKYYLICNYDKYEDISNYRLDRIVEIELLDDKAKPFHDLKGASGQNLNLSDYMKEHVYMYSSNTTRVKLRVVNAMISDVIDLFGTDVRFSDKNETHVTVSVKANEIAVLQFAKNYAPDVVVLEPQEMREKAIADLQKGLAGYQ